MGSSRKKWDDEDDYVDRKNHSSNSKVQIPPTSVKRIRCQQAGKSKFQYKTEQKALKAISFFDEESFKNKTPPNRAYYCSSCNCWHVASAPKKVSLHIEPVIVANSESHRHTEICWEADNKKCYENTYRYIRTAQARGFSDATIRETLNMNVDQFSKALVSAPQNDPHRHYHNPNCWGKGSPCFKTAGAEVYSLVVNKNLSFSRIASIFGHLPVNVIKNLYDNTVDKHEQAAKKLAKRKPFIP